MPEERDTLDEVKSQAVPEASGQPEVHRPKTAKEREEEKARLLAEYQEEQRLKKEEQKHKKELENRRLKRKLITPGIALSICLIAAVTMFFMHFENDRMLVWLLIILIVSLIVGRLVQYMFERFARQNEDTVSDEGEVINKGSVKPEDVNGEAHG